MPAIASSTAAGIPTSNHVAVAVTTATDNAAAAIAGDATPLLSLPSQSEPRSFLGGAGAGTPTSPLPPHRSKFGSEWRVVPDQLLQQLLHSVINCSDHQFFVSLIPVCIRNCTWSYSTYAFTGYAYIITRVWCRRGINVPFCHWYDYVCMLARMHIGIGDTKE